MAFERSKVPAPASGVKGGAGCLQTGACCAEIGWLWDLLEDAFGPRASRDAPGPFDLRDEGLKRLAAGFDFIRWWRYDRRQRCVL